MKKTILLLFALVYATISFSQMPGLTSSYYSGLVGVRDNPAFATNGVKIEIHLYSLGTSTTNDLLYYKNMNNFSLPEFTDFSNGQIGTMLFLGGLKQDVLLKDNKAALNMDLNFDRFLPGLLFSVGEYKNTRFGLSASIRNQSMINGVSRDLVSIFNTNSLDSYVFYSKKFQENGFTIMSNSWMEYTLTFAQKFNIDDLSISFGTNLKALVGNGLGYMRVSNLEYILGANNTINHIDGEMTYIYDKGFNAFTDGNIFYTGGSLGFGYDFGLTIEYDTDFDDDKDLVPDYRFGISIVDMGKINYQKNIYQQDYQLLNIFVPENALNVDNANELADNLDTYFNKTEIQDDFIFNLPSKVNIFADAEIPYTIIHISGQAFLSRKYQTINEEEVYGGNLFIITPKLEVNRFSLYFPVSYFDKYDMWSVGSGISLLNMFSIGSGDIITNLIKSTDLGDGVYSSNFYFSVRIPLTGLAN